jgi:hypothetical protein
MLSAQYTVSPHPARHGAMLGQSGYQQPVSTPTIVAGIGGFLLGLVFGWWSAQG